MNGPDYDWPDLAYWGGFMGGVAVAYPGLAQIGVTNYWVRLILALLLGAGVGWLCLRIFMRSQGPPQDPYDGM